MTPHLSAEYINRSIVPLLTTQQLKSHAINYIDAVNISKALKEDAKSYFYSSAISIADALNGIRASYYTWATVKLYYATFYSLRSLLALDDYAIFYIGSKPRIIRARVGELIRTPRGGRRAATTHGLVIETFNTNLH